MKLKASFAREAKHKDFVTSVGWLNSDEVFSAADDHALLKWNLISGESHNLATLPDNLFPTDMHWFPRGLGGAKKGTSEQFVLTSTDGKFYFISKTGRIEKTVDAHHGAVLSARWSFDGTSLLTVGEDGQVKIWSRSGMLRSTLAQNASPVYNGCWSPDNGQVLFTCGRNLHVKSLQANSKPNIFKAHDGVVLKVDWSPGNNLIISAGEDCKYKVWDAFCRLLYASAPHDYPVTSLAWAPDGELFVIGSYNVIRLCDKAGWSHSLEKQPTGSILNVAWSPDGTQVAAACANGHVVFGQVIEHHAEWREVEAVQTKRKTIEVRSVGTDAKEKLELRDRIVKMTLGWGHMVVATSTQCYIHSSKNWNTPIIVDLKEGSVTLIVLTGKHFLLVDGASMSVLGYDGRQQCQIKYAGMRTDVLTEKTVALSNDTLAIKDKNDEKQIFIFDAQSGKPVGDGKIVHSQEITEISIDQCGSANERRVAFVDRNNEVFLAAVKSYGSGQKAIKLGSMVQTIKFNDITNMLCGLQDSQMFVWCFPSAAYADKELLPKTIIQKEQGDFGKNPRLLSFIGNRVTVRRSDGCVVSAAVSPFVGVLHGYVEKSKWDDALRICRHVKDDVLWATLATMAAYFKNLNTAEIAYGAINEAEKVQYLRQLRSSSGKDSKQGELSLLSGNVLDAENSLLQNGQILRAIMLNLELCRWERALELATKHKTHVDTVLAFRQKYLEEFELKETKSNFIALGKEIDVDLEHAMEKVTAELQKDKNR